jgi:hypothetical protein
MIRGGSFSRLKDIHEFDVFGLFFFYMTTHLEQQPALSPGSLTSILPSGARAPNAPEPEGYEDISLL